MAENQISEGTSLKELVFMGKSESRCSAIPAGGTHLYVPLEADRCVESRRLCVFGSRIFTCETHYFDSRKRYPIPRTVWISWFSSPSFFRNDRIWTSIVRSKTRVSAPNAASINSLRSKARPGCRMSVSSSRNSLGVSSMLSPSNETRWRILSIVTPHRETMSELDSDEVALRRSSDLIRSNKILTLNGLTT